MAWEVSNGTFGLECVTRVHSLNYYVIDFLLLQEFIKRHSIALLLLFPLLIDFVGQECLQRTQLSLVFAALRCFLGLWSFQYALS